MDRLFSRGPFRWAWIAWTGWLLYIKWNAPIDHPYHMMLPECISYADSLADNLAFGYH